MGVLIERSASPEGGRSLWIHLTPAGQRVLAKCEAEVDTFEARLFERVTRREAAQFRELLHICREAARIPPPANGRRMPRAASGTTAHGERRRSQ